MKPALTTVLTVLAFLGPALMVLVALGTRRDRNSSQFWLRVGLVFVSWCAVLLGLLYLQPLN